MPIREEEAPDFSDPPGYIDAATDEELLPKSFLESKPQVDFDVDSVVIVENLPKVDVQKLARLKNAVFSKLFGKSDQASQWIASSVIPVADNMTKGYAFFKMHNAELAKKLIQTKQHVALDKSHVFELTLYGDFERFKNEDIIKPYQQRVYRPVGNLLYWLVDKEHYTNDQFFALSEYDQGNQHFSQTYLFWNTPGGKPVEEFHRSNFTETRLRWSPFGRYIATYHRQGISLWGGPQLSQVNKFGHRDVMLCDFSPCERFLTTVSRHNDMTLVRIWDVQTGGKCREIEVPFAPDRYPVVRWSQNGDYFARIFNDRSIVIADNINFTKINSLDIVIEGSSIREFSWSPSENILAYSVAEVDEIPMKLTLIQLAQQGGAGVVKQEISTKTIVTAKKCYMNWQSAGDYLAVLVERYRRNKSKDKASNLYYTICVFRLRHKPVPVENIDIKNEVKSMAWEPNGHRFAIIHGAFVDAKENPMRAQSGIGDQVAFYVVPPGEDAGVQLIQTIQRETSEIYWSPRGQFCALRSTKSNESVVEFYEISADGTGVQLIGSGNHSNVTDLEWDPTGRFVISYSSKWARSGGGSSSNYKIWSFQGRALHEANMPNLCSIKWRPRPKTMLKEEDLRAIRRNMKEWSKKFEEEDRLLSSQRAQAELRRRRDLDSQHGVLMDKWRVVREEDNSTRQSLRPTTDDLEEISETIEVLTKTVEEPFVKT